MKKILLYITMFILGILLGIVSRLLDIYTDLLGMIFSGVSIWILFCTFIVYKSKTRMDSMINTFLFCIGMVISYYLVADYTNGFWGWIYFYAWCGVACISPLFALFVFQTKYKGKRSIIIKLFMIVVTLIATKVLMSKIRFFDIIIVMILAVVLFRKIGRNS